MIKDCVLFVGLGNPGPAYQDHRHNLGAQLLIKMAQEQGASFSDYSKLKSKIATVNVDQTKLIYVLPQTYMNQSGEALSLVLNFFKIAVDANVWVFHDELDFEPGVIKVKYGGGHGGHNGLRNIIQHTRSQNFARLRIGVGHPGSKDLVAAYVLNQPTKSEAVAINNSFSNVLTHIDYFYTKNEAFLQDFFNAKKDT